jgi:folylpolyglutamate synthase/dihydropteroate synthase
VAAKDVTEALRLLADASDVPARILICGSLYLAGAVLAENDKP